MNLRWNARFGGSFRHWSVSVLEAVHVDARYTESQSKLWRERLREHRLVSN